MDLVCNWHVNIHVPRSEDLSCSIPKTFCDLKVDIMGRPFIFFLYLVGVFVSSVH